MVKFVYINAGGDEIEMSVASGFIVTDFRSPSSNDISLSESQALSQVGSTVSGHAVNSKTISIEGVFKSVSNGRKELLDAVLPAVPAKFRYVNTKEKIDVYWDVYPKRTPEITNNRCWESFSFDMLAPYPYPRNWEPVTTNFAYTRATHRFRRSYSSTVPWKLSEKIIKPLNVVSNTGSMPTGFTATLIASANGIKNPKILNVDTREYIGFTSLTMQDSDVLQVCTVPGKCAVLLTRNGVTSNAIPYMDYESTFFVLPRGKSNIKITADTNSNSLDAMIVVENVTAGV